MYPEAWGRAAAIILFVGFNLTFFPQFILGYEGMPRRYATYDPSYQILNILSSSGGGIMGLGYLLPMIYLPWSLKNGAIAGPNPFRATGLEWATQSPPTTFNFDRTPIVTHGPYLYSAESDELLDAEMDLQRAHMELALTQSRIDADHHRESS
jgi:cytochrome c oxidase subunit 1